MEGVSRDFNNQEDELTFQAENKRGQLHPKVGGGPEGLI